MNLLCLIGIHDWKHAGYVGFSPVKTEYQRCERCGLKREIDVGFLFWKATKNIKKFKLGGN